MAEFTHSHKFWMHFADIDDEDEMAEVEQFVTACYDGRHSTSHTIEKVSNHF